MQTPTYFSILIVCLPVCREGDRPEPPEIARPQMGYDGLAGWDEEEPMQDKMHTQVLEQWTWTGQEWSWQIC